MPQTLGSLGSKRPSSGDVSLLFSLDDQVSRLCIALVQESSPTVSSIRSVESTCLSQRLDQLGSDETNGHEHTLEMQRTKLSCVLSSDAERKVSQCWPQRNSQVGLGRLA